MQQPSRRCLSLTTHLAAQANVTAPDRQDHKLLARLWDDHCQRFANEDDPTAHRFHTTPIDILWNEYRSSDKPLANDELLELSRRVKKAGGPDTIKRIQILLRDMHAREKTPMVEMMFVYTCNMLLHLFIKRYDLKSARLVFDGMIDSGHCPTEISVCTMIDGMAKLGTSGDLHSLYNSLQKRNLVPETHDVYQKLITAFGERGDIEGCNGYFSKMVAKQLDNSEAYHTMLETFANARQPDSILALYHQMIKRNVKPFPATYSIVLIALRRHGRTADMEMVHRHLLESDTDINASHYSAMGWDPKRALQEMRAVGTPRTTRDYNNFILFFIKQNRFFEAHRMIKEMQKEDLAPNAISYSILIDCVQKDPGFPTETAFELYDEMIANDIMPDVVIYSSLIAACGQRQDVTRALGLLSEMEKYKIKPNLHTFNTILTVVASKQKPTWTELEQADLLWRKMNKMHIMPDTRIYNVYLSLMSQFARPLAGAQKAGGEDDEQNSKVVPRMLDMYRTMRTSRARTCRPDFLSYSILIDTLMKSGATRSALTVYSDAKMVGVKLPVWTYNALMRGLEETQQLTQVLPIWHDMKALNVLPDQVSYELALEACEQLGLHESFESIRSQRKRDFARLIRIEQEEEGGQKKRADNFRS